MVCASKPTAMAFVKSAGRRFTIRVIMRIIEKKSKKMLALKTALCFVRANAGIKTCVNAPSAKMRRKRFGSLNAMKKMSL